MTILKDAFERDFYHMLTSETLSEIVALKGDSTLSGEKLKAAARDIMKESSAAVVLQLTQNCDDIASAMDGREIEFLKALREYLVSQATAKLAASVAKEKGLDLSSPPSGMKLN